MTAGRAVSPDLARRYRRLLRWYPPAHRAAHGDEMLGVLMEAAEPGRQRPAARDALDLVRGGLVIRARRLRVDPDALAVLTIVAPLVLMIGTTIGLHEVAWFLVVGHSVPPWSGFPEAPAYAAWFVLVPLGWLGFRRTAAAGAWIATVALGYLLHQDFGGHYLGAPDKAGWVALAALGAVAMTVSARPRRGLELLGARRLIAVAAAVGLVLLAGAGGHRTEGFSWAVLPVLAVAVVLSCRPARPTLRRAVTLVASLVAISLSMALASPFFPAYPTVAEAVALASPLAAVLTILLTGTASRAPAPSAA